MSLDAPEDLAMILPLPVPQPAKEDAVTFINLEFYKELFKDLEKGFPPLRGRYRGPPAGSLPEPDPEPLKVHSVGAFEASFVPNRKSFPRLDERFRLADGTWDKLPQYANYGFAVFKLKKGRSDIHPLALKFPTVLGKDLYFPTVHIHDGKIHAKEKFDHILYAQVSENATLRDWRESEQLASEFVQREKTKGLLWEHGHVYRKPVAGARPKIAELGGERISFLRTC